VKAALSSDSTFLKNEMIDKQIADKSTELQALTNQLELAEQDDVVSNKKAAHSIPPSKLNPTNIHQARGSVDIHDRDSGVARHEAFLAVL
jgi:hypothetical protein